MHKPWTTQADTSEPKHNWNIIRIYFFKDEPMFGLGSTPDQHRAITKNLNVSYNLGVAGK